MVKIEDGKKRHDAGFCTYIGNHESLVGEVRGPLTYGGMVIAVEAEYNPETNKTRVKFAHAIEGDLDADLQT